MSPKIRKTNPSKTTTLRRNAALLCAALTSLGAGFGLAGRVAAQATGPLGTSPPTPTPFQSPVYHGGGGPTPYPVAVNPIPPAAPIPPTFGPYAEPPMAPYLTPLIDPLQGQLQGTPTGVYQGNITQIPSYLLGDFDPTRPPAGIVGGPGGNNVFYANHFQDGSFYSWSAPFSYVGQGATTVTTDDSSGLPTAGGSGFAYTGGWNSIADPVANPSAETATNVEYLRLPSGSNGSATWTLYQPAAGSYSVYLHIPTDLPDANGNPEIRDTQVVYAIAVLDAAGNVTTTTTASASQTEANDSQFLAGPFEVAAGGSVVVTLTRSVGTNGINNGTDYLVADSMTLQQTVGDVQSAPTVVNTSHYPADFSSAAHPLQYWGIFTPDLSPTTTAAAASLSGGTTAVANANPDTTGAVLNATTANINNGNIVLKTGDPNFAFKQDGVTADPTHLRQIRQLVYFGRSDPSASVSSSLDDSNAGFTGGGARVTNTTASNGEYKSFGTAEGLAANAGVVATWSVPVPVTGPGTSFFVYAHIPANSGNPAETRLSQVYYRVITSAGTYGPVAISQVTQGTDALVTLPTGALTAAAGTRITVQMFNVNNSTTVAPANGSVVVADSVTVSTGSGQGAIYCVDGFTGGVVWRYETPGAASGPSAPVFASPVITKINVLVTPAVYGVGGTITTPAVYANRLVAIVGDNNGQVYCLDAIGNGDGTSNANALVQDANGNPISGQPLTIPQPAYGGVYGADPAGIAPLVAGTPAGSTTVPGSPAATAHVGTTGVYWVYRPDASRPKYISGANAGAVKPIDPTADLPVPAAFATASPNVFVDPTISTVPDPATGVLQSNAIVYIGSSNGVLYALNALGAGIDGTSAATYTASGDAFNVSQMSATLDIPTGNAANPYPLTAVVPTPTPLWWFSLRGVDPNGGNNASSADIESAPAIYVKDTPAAAGATLDTFTPTVYIGSAHELEATSNIGRLYALSGLYGPSGNNGKSSPLTQPNPAAAGYTGPGSFNYNVGQRPQDSKADTADWSFPDAVGKDAYTTKSQSSNGKPRPALGNVTGSPVVFTNTDENAANQNADGSPRQTRIYFAAGSGLEGTNATPVATARPDDGTTGRLWAVNLDGSVGTTTNSGPTGQVWSYPLAIDPNNIASDTTAEPDSPMGAFLRATPAIGFVQFPTTILNGDGSAYNPIDAVHAGIDGQSVPMLYVGTDGVNDTSLNAINIDGSMTSDGEGTTTSADTRTIYRLVSPDGSIYQSSPVLISNATYPAGSPDIPKPGPGNGGSVYAVAGNTLYDYSATPISNPNAGETQPIVPENKAIAGFGPISSPAVAGADTTDQAQAFLANNSGAVGLGNTSGFTSNTTDWVYVGDSSTGLCRGITPFDTSYGGIAIGLGSIVPFDANAPTAENLTAFIQVFLVDPVRAPGGIPQNSHSSADAAQIGVSAPLPVFEWGESAAVRFTNVAPPNPPNKTTGKVDPSFFVYDTRLYTAAALADASAHPVPFYTSDGSTGMTGESVQFQVSDVSAAATRAGIEYLAPQILTGTPYTDGYTIDVGTPPSFFKDVTTNLVANNGHRYLGVYTYSIGDGSARDDTPGARRKFQEVKQYVTEYDYKGGGLTDIANYTPIPGRQLIGGDSTSENIVPQLDPKTGQYTFTNNSKIAAVDQPTFGVLNPLGVRGGGVPVLPVGQTQAVPVGDELGPFRSAQSPPTLTTTGGVTTTPPGGDAYTLQALANGNDIPTAAPPSSSGSTGNPTLRPEGANDPNGVTTPTTTRVVVTTTREIANNSTGDNSDNDGGAVIGKSANGGDGLPSGTLFGGYGLDVFDRSALYNLGQTLRLKMTVPTNTQFAPASGKDGMYWNSNFGNPAAYPPNPDNTGHDSVVNFLPWETPPVSYKAGAGNMTNGSQDYPDIAPGNITQNATSNANSASPGDLTSNSVTLPQATAGTAAAGQSASTTSRTVYGDPVRIQVTVPPYQPANQQLYQQPVGLAYTAPATTGSQEYRSDGEIAPVDENGNSRIGASINGSDNAFPMGYVTTKRLFVPSGRGLYNPRRAYRDVRIYTGVQVDMQTSVVTPTADIGDVPAAFGVQTESDPNYGLFSPYAAYNASTNTLTPAPFGSYFKPLEIHNDGNVNLLNIHFDQKVNNNGTAATLQLFSDAVDPLSFLQGYDLSGVTGPRPTGTLSPVPEQPFLIRTSVDTDLYDAYGRNPYIVNNYSAIYPGATFHKPTPGGSQPSTLMVPDAPERYVAGASPATGTRFQVSPTGTPILSTSGASGVTYQAEPFVSLAMPFGTPVGTYATPSADQINSLRLFEGLDTAAGAGYNPNTAVGAFYPPVYGNAIGGYYGPQYNGTPPRLDSSGNGEIQGTNGDEGIFNGSQPLSTSGTQLVGTVVEHRLTDGATAGAVPMIDAGPAASVTPTGGGNAVPTSTPDFAPAAFRDPATGDLSVYWTSGRSGGFGIFGANLPFHPDTTSNTPGAGYFLPDNPSQTANPITSWWKSIGGYTTATPPALLPVANLAANAVNSGLSITPTGTPYAYGFDVAVSTAPGPYSNTLYSYIVTASSGVPAGIMRPITTDTAQVKYGVHGLYTGVSFANTPNTPNLWAFWTASTRGRTAIYYNSQSNGTWLPTVPTVGLLPVPAGLTAVADASPLLMTAPVNGSLVPTIEVTYSGTAPDGNIDLYVSRYVPDAKTPAQLDLVAFPPVTENLRAADGWYQARDAAWARTGALNVSVTYPGSNGPHSLLYSPSNTPLFRNAIYDKASGFLVLTHVAVPNSPLNVFYTVTVDAATGRIRFSPALSTTTQNFTPIQATFSPQARRLTIDSRADTAPVTFMDEALKPNDSAVVKGFVQSARVEADRRWTIWRKAGTAGVPSSATLYFKAQRLTLFLPPVPNTTTGKYVPIDPTQPVTVSVNGTDVSSLVDVDYLRGRIYFPIRTGAEGLALGSASQGIVVTYTPFGFTSRSTSADPNNTVQWQDEQLANDDTVPPADSAAGLDTVLDYKVPIKTAVNENNVAAFLDPFAGQIGVNNALNPHKVWLFWNSTRNGTADIYSETIDPLFAPELTTPQ